MLLFLSLVPHMHDAGEGMYFLLFAGEVCGVRIVGRI